MPSFVTFSNVGKIYHTGELDITALHDVNFEIEKGEFCVIVGASGAGKTTILNMISMIDKPDSGSISINGKNSFSKKDVQDLRRYVFGYIFQNYALIENDTVKENLLLSKKYRKNFKEKEDSSKEKSIESNLLEDILFFNSDRFFTVLFYLNSFQLFFQSKL